MATKLFATIEIDLRDAPIVDVDDLDDDLVCDWLVKAINLYRASIGGPLIGPRVTVDVLDADHA